MRLSRPSTGTVLGAIALFVALGGSAPAATGQLVNIADPSNAANVAHVDSAGKLEVGDGTGAMTVDGTVTAQQSAPASFFHAAQFGLTAGSCRVVATPPTGKALIVRDVKVNTYDDPTPGSSNRIGIYADGTCSNLVADVNPPTVGVTVLPFEPGLGIKAGSALSALVVGNPSAEVYVDGYTVPSGAVPVAAAAIAQHGPTTQR